ncbi:MAG: DUF4389 domain-containing protein [candidate division FCPU426 bacterium]
MPAKTSKPKKTKRTVRSKSAAAAPAAIPAKAAAGYPVGLAVNYPEREQDRLSVFFRPLLAIPICILLGLLLAGGGGAQISIAGFLVLPTLLMLLFRHKYPKWWFEWNLGLAGFTTRVAAYCLLLDDVYPSTDEEQKVHLRLPYPQAERELNRWLPLVKWLLAIPHFVILAVLELAAFIVVILAWLALLFTGRFPRGMFDFVVGVLRWHLRVAAYSILLTTDHYPPFQLEE